MCPLAAVSQRFTLLLTLTEIRESLKSQVGVGLLQTAHYWANAGVLFVGWTNGVSRIFFWGGATRYIFRHLSGSRPLQWGGGVVADIFPVDKSITFPRFRDIFGTFSGHLRITRRLWTLKEIQAHFPGLITHSSHVTTSIHSRKKHLPNVWGAMAPLAPPGYATGVDAYVGCTFRKV